VVSVSGLVFGEYAARGEIQAQLQDLMGEQDAGAVQSLLASVRKPAEGLTATAVGLVLLFVGATTVFAELQNTLGRFAGGGITLGVLFSAEFICVYALTFGSRSSG
jgi:membrane protein